MKLLYCIDERGLTGGAHLATELMIAALQKRGHTVDVMQAIPRNSFWGLVHRAYARINSTLHLHLPPTPNFLRDPFGFKFRQMKRYDTVCVMSENSVFPPIVTRLPPSVRKVQLIHTNYPMWAKLKGRDIAADGKLFSKFDCIACVGTIGARQFEEMFPACKGKVVPFHNIINHDAKRCEKGEPCRGGEGEEKVGGGRWESEVRRKSEEVRRSRRAMAEKKVAEWLADVDAAAFEVALQRLVDEKTARGEYKFKRPDERESALEGARRFYRDFSRKIIPLSDGRYVYFAPDQRSKARNASTAISWAEYAFHAVSSSGKLLDGKNFRERIYNATKVADLPVLESVIRAEQCMYRLIDAYPENDAVIFVGQDAQSGRLEVVTRLDQFGNAEANLGEVTVIAKHKSKEIPPPKFRPLTEVVEAVAKHQAAGFSPSTTKNSIANPPSPRKGGNENSTVDLDLISRPNTPVRLISLARINDKVAKDGPRMIRVAKRLKDSGIDFVWDNYGGSGNGLVACQQEVARLGLTDIFRIHPFDPNARARIADADIFVLLSHYEGLPNVIYEARMMGLPVFATSVGGIPEQIEDGKTGWLVEDNEEAIVKRLISILGHSAEGIIRPGPLQYDNDAIVRQTEEFLTCIK